MSVVAELAAPPAVNRWPPSLSTFSIVLVTFAVGMLAGISVASSAFGVHPRCLGTIERWEREVVLPCEHWNGGAGVVVERHRLP